MKLPATSVSLLVLLFLPSHTAAQARWSDPALEGRIDSLLSLMTPEEKAGQLNQVVGHWDEKARRVVMTPEHKALIKKGLIGSFLNAPGAEVTREFQRVAVEESRLHIPLLFGLDVIHGFRTAFPIPLAEASSWDPDDAELSARIGAIEASAAGVNWTFAPMVDIARDPRWGRIAEGSGEDPFLGSTMAAARVRGFQGSSFRDSSTIVACAKHFAAYGGAEAGKDYNTVDVSERTLREVYLAPFKAAVEAGVGTLMSSFNEIGGIPSTANRKLLTQVLRNEWGFKGFVVSDWTAIAELQSHGVAGTGAEAALKALTAGSDMDMASGLYVRHVPALVRSGMLRTEILDEAVRRILRVKFALGLFGNPYRNCHPELENALCAAPRFRDVARRIAGKSIVLLKNNQGLLPLRKDLGTIAVIGPLAVSRRDPLGPWHGWYAKSEEVVTVLEGIRGKVSGQTRVLYSPGCDTSFADTSGFAEAVRIAGKSDVAVLVLGERMEMSGEAASRSSIDIPGVQKELAKRIHSTGRPVVLVLMNGRPLCLPWEAGHIPAILEAWFLGVESGNAVADVLFGDLNPCGKLPVTFPRSVGQIPIYYNHKSTGRPFVDSNKYTSKYLDLPSTPLYPFGFGLSYTTFGYSNVSVTPRVTDPQGRITVTVDIENSGTRKGDEVVQLYVRDEVASVTRPVKELKNFKRITLEPGARRTVAFTLDMGQLRFYDTGMRCAVEPGTFRIFVGGDSERTLEAVFEVVAQ